MDILSSCTLQFLLANGISTVWSVYFFHFPRVSIIFVRTKCVETRHPHPQTGIYTKIPHLNLRLQKFRFLLIIHLYSALFLPFIIYCFTGKSSSGFFPRRIIKQRNNNIFFICFSIVLFQLHFVFFVLLCSHLFLLHLL